MGFTVTTEPELTPVEKFRLAIALSHELETIMLQRLRAQAPEADEAEIHRRLLAWRQHRPGAENGDAVGRSVPWPRPR